VSTATIGRGLDLAGRLLVAALFWWSAAIGVALDWTGTVGFVAAKGVPLPTVAAAGAGLFELLAPLGLFHRRSACWAAVALAGYCMATGVLFHDWWNLGGGARANQTIHFMKNLALAGALLTLAASPLRERTGAGVPGICRGGFQPWQPKSFRPADSCGTGRPS
jgi:putative oxidoreductase